MTTRIAIAGAAGRMGRRLIALAAADSSFSLAAALEHSDSPALGVDAGVLAGEKALGVVVSANWTGGVASSPQSGDAAVMTDSRSAAEVAHSRSAAGMTHACGAATAVASRVADVLIEFSTPAGTLAWLDLCVRRKLPIVIGTTGHDETHLSRIRDAATQIPVLKAANMSVGVNVLLRVARLLGRTLDASYDVEIVESHHRFKIDAPSGTAVALRDAVSQGRKDAGHERPVAVYGRHGQTGARPAGEIGIHAVRIGDTIGEHAVHFGTLGETITIGHAAHTRDTFASGALRAAKWLVGRPARLYDMQDVLFGAGE